MATVEIDEAQLATLNKAYQLLDTLTKKPETKREFERVVKKAFPDVQTTDDMAKEYTEPLAGRLESIEKMLKTREEKEQDRELEAAFDEVRKSRNLTDEGVEKLKKFMVDHKVGDVGVAADAFLARVPKEPVVPNGMEPGGWNFADQTEDNAGMLDDTDNYFDKVAARVWNEERAKIQRGM